MNHSNQPGPDREKEIFEQALDLASVDAQIGFVKGACGGDIELLARVQTLLRAHQAPAGFLPENPGPATAVTARFPLNQAAEDTGAVIGRYKLLQKIGEGGCGTVYMAQQEEPVRRRVALKVIKLGMDTKEVIARFGAERQALAMMDHPNIAKVLDAGATETGRPFFAMELVKGIPITKYCDENNLSTEERLKLFAQVCNAVQHAHQKGIIHRDIKPSNILVTLHDGVPVPKVIDFGIAKATQGRLTDHTLFTAFEQFIGTPAYMSPEQAEMSGLDIDTRSDIYSLGVLLYELLTGGTPFETKALMQAGLDEMRRQIREVEPQRPSTRLGTLEKATLTTTAQHRQTDAQKLVNLVGGDLDWIVMRCLEKDRTRRYETATSLADDIGRHLGNEPVTARPPSTAYRLSKAIRRNKVAFGAGIAVAASLAIGLIVAITAYIKEKAAHEFAVQTAVSKQQGLQAYQNEAEENSTLGAEVRASDKKARIEAARNAYTLPLLKETFKGVASGSIAAASRAQLLQSLDQAADRLSRDTVTPPEAKNDVYDTLGDAYMELGEFGRAEQMFRELLALRRKLFGPLHPETAAALGKFIEVLKREGKSHEAEAELSGSKVMQLELRRTEPGAISLARIGHELLQQGKYAEAETDLREAQETFRSLGGEFAVINMQREIASLRFQAGDFSGAREIAEEWLRIEKERWWWDSIYYGGEYNARITSANLLLGRIALRAGDLVAARDYLLKALEFGTGSIRAGMIDYQLPAELLEAGERDAVIRFLDLLKKYYVDDWKSGYQSYYHDDDPYRWTSEALGRVNAVNLDHWRKDAVAGRLPDDWKKLITSPPPAASSGSLKPLPPHPVGSPLVREIRFLTSQLQYPVGFQMLGWVLAMPVLCRRPRVFKGLSFRIVSWVSALGVLSIVEGATLLALYWGVFLHVPLVVSQTFCALAAGIVLCEIRGALRGETTAGRMTLLLRVSLACLVIFFSLKAGFTDKQGLAPDFIYFMMVVARLLLWVTSIGIVLGVAWELWKWTKLNATLPSQTKFCLYLAAPILGAQAVTGNWPFLESNNYISRPLAIVLLWLNVLLPWLMVCGFIAARKQVKISSTIPLAAAR